MDIASEKFNPSNRLFKKRVFTQREDTPTIIEDYDKGIVVIGGGIAGIQAALDLANAGIQVYLIEKRESIGGMMSKLAEIFPSMDCAT